MNNKNTSSVQETIITTKNISSEKESVMAQQNFPFDSMMKSICSFEYFPKRIRELDSQCTVIAHLLKYIYKHDKIFVCRLDLQFPANEKFQRSDFSFYKMRDFYVHNALQCYQKKLKDKYKNCDPQYFYVIEKSPENKYGYDHYHLLYMLNGNVVEHIKYPFEILNGVWNKQLGLNENRNYGLVQKSKASKNNSKYMPEMMKKFNEAWYDSSIDSYENLNTELQEIFQNNKDNQDEIPYDGILLNKNSPAFLFDFYIVLYTAMYLIKERQKKNVEQRKKINLSVLKLEKDNNEIRKFVKDLLAMCIKKDKNNFYETYKGNEFSNKILLLGSTSKKQQEILTYCNNIFSENNNGVDSQKEGSQPEQVNDDNMDSKIEGISSCNLTNNTINTPDDIDIREIFDNKEESEQITICSETKKAETAAPSITPQKDCTKANHDEENLYMVDSGSNNLLDTSTGDCDDFDVNDSPVGENPETQSEQNNSHAETSPEKANWSSNQEIYNENELNDDDLSEARQLANEMGFIHPNIFAKQQKVNSCNLL